ncbi:uncharacterized protein Ecym_3010 [Eremothecium cymbalariae DBVPG|uniref:Uncharacterized protein n=1 Tax=Eremothecium cymbalariae (strain CBS 270.75 / DBVPG 7215 / KCTC 17166 / NRRL Y-17582) TaxID=931890 RepID=G8JQW0_ERECY|nr:Hypothetical protein Ecym_3010 [Eremothecium cymbalariae DBVPG\
MSSSRSESVTPTSIALSINTNSDVCMRFDNSENQAICDGTKHGDEDEDRMNTVTGISERTPPYSVSTRNTLVDANSSVLDSEILSLGKRQRILKGQLQSMSPQERLERQRAMRRRRDNAYRARKRATELTVDPDLEQLFTTLDTSKQFHSISVKYDAASLSQEFFPRVLLNKSETDDPAPYKAPFDSFIEGLRNKIKNVCGIKLSKERTSVHITSVSCVLYCSQDKSHQRLIQSKDIQKSHNLDNAKQYQCQSYMRVNYSFKTHVLSIKFRHTKHNEQAILPSSTRI